MAEETPDDGAAGEAANSVRASLAAGAEGVEVHHQRRPLNSWRELGQEVAIIVLGVLIALLGQRSEPDSRHWHEQVTVVRTSKMRELANDRARWEADQADVACTLGDIDRIDRWTRAAPAGGTPPSLANGEMLWMHSSAWGIAASSQALDHFPLQQQLDFASLYDGIAHREVTMEGETDAVHRVRTLIPLAADAQGRRELAVALGDLKGKIADLVANNGYMIRHFDAVGVKP